jgi:non-homologous end joining protein Ku
VADNDKRWQDMNPDEQAVLIRQISGAVNGLQFRVQDLEHIVDSKAADFDPLTFRDRYEEALLAHLKAKQAGAVEERKPTFAAPQRVINLMEALRRSIAEDKKRVAPRTRAAAAPTRKRA